MLDKEHFFVGYAGKLILNQRVDLLPVQEHELEESYIRKLKQFAAEIYAQRDLI